MRTIVYIENVEFQTDVGNPAVYSSQALPVFLPCPPSEGAA